ncbi:hypothetical protein ACWKWP_03805 [Agromyces soli]
MFEGRREARVEREAEAEAAAAVEMTEVDDSSVDADEALEAEEEPGS